MVASTAPRNALLALGTVILLTAFAAAETNEKCAELGFTGVLCSDCKELKEIVKDQELTAECEGCCSNQATSGIKYKKAVLEVCGQRISSYPNLDEFVKKHAKDFPNLKISYRWGTPPRLTLKSGGKQETARIDAWKTEQIVEFLQDKLLPPVA